MGIINSMSREVLRQDLDALTTLLFSVAERLRNLPGTTDRALSEDIDRVASELANLTEGAKAAWSARFGVDGAVQP